MDIVYFGTDVFLSCFEYLSQRHTIRALYTYHNDEDYFTEYEIVRQAVQRGITVHYEAVSTERTREYFRTGAALYFVAEYNRIIEIPERLPSFRGVNVHSSALPEGRSYYPIEVAMERGLPRTGVTVHKLKPRLDSGDILSRRLFEISPEMDSVDVYLRCASLAREMTEEIFSDFQAAWDGALVQREKLPYWRKPAKEKLTLTHEMSVSEALRVFRSYNCMTEVKLSGVPYFVKSVMRGQAELPAEELRLSDELFLYSVRDGHLRLFVKPIEGNGG